MLIHKLTSSALLLAIWCASAHGQDLTGDVIKPKADLPLRASPPGFFQSKGDLVGKAESSSDYRVLEQRNVPTISGSEQWIKVQPLAKPDKDGWIYSGPAGNPTANIAR